MAGEVIHIPFGLQAFDREEITVSTVAIGLTAAEHQDTDTSGVRRPATAVLMTVHDQPIRMTLEGTTPTNTLGHSIQADATLLIGGLENIKNLQMIREGGSDAEVEVTYLR